MKAASENSLSPESIRYGIDEPFPERIGLRAGPLSLVFDAGDLREIRFGRDEVVRRVYVAVRDKNWDTVPTRVSEVRLERNQESFAITYQAENLGGGVDFVWRAAIRGENSGTIRFQMEGEARSPFLRNRLGLCVHHPIAECVGKVVRVEHGDGSITDGAFPSEISPHQPFREIKTISHEVAAGVRAEVLLSGEVFEMEDQRNWTDASFKTYCTPLDRPFPVEVARGERIEQSCTISLSGRLPSATPTRQLSSHVEDPIVVGDGPPIPLPGLGLGAASHGQPLRPVEVARLRTLNISHLRVDLTLSRTTYPETLRIAAEDATRVGVPLDVALVLSDNGGQELDSLLAACRAIKPVVQTWWVFHEKRKSTPEDLARLARRVLLGYNPSANIGGGTNAYFAELNRERPPVSVLDLVGYSLNPQVHAFDRVSLVENLGAQGVTVANARRLAGGLPVAVGPITLRPRFNPNATVPEAEPGPGELPTQVDPRQMSLFGACWLVGSLKALALAGASRLTYFETTGWRGVMETEEGSPIPDRFPSLPGSVFPLYHVLADLGEFSGGGVLPLTCEHPAAVEGMALIRDDRLRVILANPGPTPRRVRVSNLRGRASVRQLDTENAIESMRSPESFRTKVGEPLPTNRGDLRHVIPPFAVVRIDAE